MTSINQAREALKNGSVSSEALVQKSAAAFEADKNSALPLNAFLEIYDDAVELAKEADKEIAAARGAGTLDALFEKKPLLGLPFGMRAPLQYVP